VRGQPRLEWQTRPVWVFWLFAAEDVPVGVRVFRGGVERLARRFGPGRTAKEAGEWMLAEFERRR
jgi:hypothetical protein